MSKDFDSGIIIRVPIKGESGEKGATGPTGAKGVGFTGPTGVMGPTGAKGVGFTGATGPTGSNAVLPSAISLERMTLKENFQELQTLYAIKQTIAGKAPMNLLSFQANSQYQQILLKVAAKTNTNVTAFWEFHISVTSRGGVPQITLVPSVSPTHEKVLSFATAVVDSKAHVVISGTAEGQNIVFTAIVQTIFV